MGINQQVEALKNGVASMLQLHWLKLFNSSEIEFLLYGKGDKNIDVEDWKRNTFYRGFEENSKTIQNFWEILQEFGQDELIKLLSFSTSLYRPPLLGFKSINPRFTIQHVENVENDQMVTTEDEESNQRNDTSGTMLPRASTCINTLYLQTFNDKDILRKKLKMAINEYEGFAF